MTKDNRPVSPINGQPLPKGRRFTSETAREAAKKSNEKQALKRSLKDCLLKELGKSRLMKDGRELTGREAMCEAAVAMALKNPKFWELIRDTIGEKPVDKKEMSHAFIGDFDIVLDGEDGD